MAGSDRSLHSLSITCFAYSKHPISCSSLLLRFVLLHSTPTFRSLYLSLSCFFFGAPLMIAINCEVILFVCLFFFPAVMLLTVASAAGWCRRLIRIRSSAPAFVFFSVLFVWLVYIAVVRQGPFLSVIFVSQFST